MRAQIIKNCRPIEFCKRCFSYVPVKSGKLRKKKLCNKHSPARVIMPSNDENFEIFIINIDFQ